MNTAIDENFFKQLPSPHNLLNTLQLFSDAIILIKDRTGKYVFGTLPFARLCRKKQVHEIIGHRDEDFFPQYLCNQYNIEDQKVFNGSSILNKEWLVPEQRGVTSWCSSSKTPIFDKENEVIGLCCMLNNFQVAEDQLQSDARLTKAITYIGKHYNEKITLEILAKLCNLSIGQFCRNFKKTFKSTPNDYIIKTRINAACIDLENTQLSVTDIAFEHGFFDCSHFAKKFLSMMGESPGKYRASRLK